MTHKLLKLLIPALILLLPISAYGQTSEDQSPGERQMNALKSMFGVQKLLLDEVFSPAKFALPFDHGPRLPVAEIVYTGDDYGWPVYAIGIYNGCLEKASGAYSKDCAGQWHALQVRAPERNPKIKTRRLRHDGSALVGNIYAAIDANPDLSFKDAVSYTGIKWQAASLNTCQGAISILETFNDYLDITPTSKTSFFLHSDMISIKVNKFQSALTLRSPASIAPGTWATDMANKLEPCWGEVSFPPPWERPDTPASDHDPLSKQ